MQTEPHRFFRPSTPKKSVPCAPKGNDIFADKTVDDSVVDSPRKFSSRMRSDIFASADFPLSPSKKYPVSPKRFESSKDKLFGGPEDSPRKIRINDNVRSKVFVTENGDGGSPRKAYGTPKKDPITGQGYMNGHSETNGDTNGYHDEAPTTPSKSSRRPPDAGIF